MRTPRHRPTLGATRLVLVAFAVLTALAVLSLFVRAADTDELFAWTIAPPLTAAFLGAGYAAGFVLVLLQLREPVWARNRIPAATVLVFTVLTLVATLLHRDKLHFDDAGALATFAAWLWTAVYVVVPVTLAVVIVRQELHPGADPPRRRPVPAVLKAALAVQATAMLLAGTALFVAPTTAEDVWPWALTPFTARVVAAWLLALGLATGSAVVVGDLDHLRTATAAYAVFGGMVLLAVLRYRDTVAWDRPVAWLFLAIAVSVLLTGAAGWAAARAPAPAPSDRRVPVA